MPQRRPGDPPPLQPVRLAAMILAPRHFVRIGLKMLAADPVVHPVFRPAKAAEPALGLVHVGTVSRDVFGRMIDPPHVIGGVQHIPAARFVGMDDGAGGDVFADQRDSGALARHDERQGAAHNLAGDHHDLALAGAFLGKPAIDPLGFLVLRLLVAAGVHAIDVNLARQLAATLNLGTQRFAELVGEDEGRLVLAIEVAAQLERGMPFGSVGEDRDGEKVIPNSPLAVGEDRPRRHGKLIPAPGAFPELASREGVNLEATTLRAVWLAVVIGPTDRGEPGMRFLVRHARNGAQRERPCGCGKKEVLRHTTHRIRYLTASNLVPCEGIVNAKSIVYDAFRYWIG